MVGRGFLNHRQPKALVKFGDGLGVFGKFKHKPADGIRLGQPLGLFFLECVQLDLRRIVPGYIAIIAFGVLLLALGASGVLLDAPLGQLSHHRDLPEQFVQFRIKGGAVGEVVLHDAAVRQQSLLAIQQLIERRQEPGFDVLLPQMGRLAFPLPGELLIALPDNAAVLAVGMPDLGTVKAVAVAADDAGGENAAAAVAVAQSLPPSELGLDNIELMGLDNGLVAFLDIILLDLALVDLPLFTEEINGIAFPAETHSGTARCRPPAVPWKR